MIVVLTGGTGGAKFIDGLRQIVPPEDLTIIVNTGDDMKWWGLYVSPDIDSITYMLAGNLSRERGWGVARDTFFCLQAMGELAQPTWFQAGDRDLATHICRTQLMAEGKTLTEATGMIAKHLGVLARVLPMSDARVETRVLTASGEVSFQEYFVRRRYQDLVKSVSFAGAPEAAPAPGVLDAIRAAEFVLVAPSNPITSIGPILAVPGIREVLRERRERTAAISPIVGQSAVSGPAGALLAAHGFAVSIGGVADCYRDFLSHLIVDSQDAKAAERLRDGELNVHCTSTIMLKDADRVALAKAVMAACHETSLARASEPA